MSLQPCSMGLKFRHFASPHAQMCLISNTRLIGPSQLQNTTLIHTEYWMIDYWCIPNHNCNKATVERKPTLLQGYGNKVSLLCAFKVIQNDKDCLNYIFLFEKVLFVYLIIKAYCYNMCAWWIYQLPYQCSDLFNNELAQVSKTKKVLIAC